MNSAVKQHPRSLPRLLGPWATLAALLLAALPSFGQTTYTGSAITIPDATLDASLPPPQPSIASKATPYGDKITIVTPYATALKGKIQKIAVILPSLTHSYVADLDVLLAGPGGKNIMVMSDVGVGMQVGGDIVISSAGTVDFPDSGAPAALLPSGAGVAYKPADFDTSDELPSPAPARPYSASLGDLVGDSGVGDWKLYVSDDRFHDSGTIAPWQLRIWYSPVLSVTNVGTISVNEDSSATVWVKIEDPDTSLDSIVVSAVSSLQTVVTNTTGLSVGARNGAWFPVTITPIANANSAGSTFTVTLRANDGTTTETIDLTVQVNALNDAPNVPSTLKHAGTNITFVATSQGAISEPYTVDVSDIDNIASELTTVTESGDTNLVMASEILFVPGETGATRTFYVAPKGAATSATTANVLRLIARDSAPSNSAPFTVGLQVSPATDRKVFANSNPIAIADLVTNSSQITVSGVSAFGTNAFLSKIAVTLANVTHPNPEDIDAWLVGPKGQKVILTSGAGGANPVVNGRLTFDSTLPTAIPDSTALIPSGRFDAAYAPADYRGPSSPTLADFVGTDPNGTWTLFVVDRTALSTGSIAGGVILSLNTAPVVQPLAAVTVSEDQYPTGAARVIAFSVSDLDGSVSSVTATVTAGDASIVGIGAVTFTSGGTSGSFPITTVANKSGTATISVTATDNSGKVGVQSFTLTINEVNDAPTITPIEKQTTYAGQPPNPVNFTIGDVETALTSIANNVGGSGSLQAISSNQDLLPDQNIYITGTGAARTIQMFPVGLNQGVADVTVTVTDTGGGGGVLSASRVFRLEVAPAATYLQQNPRSIVFRDSGLGNGPTNADPSAITVSGLVGNVTKVKVSLLGIRHPFPQDLDIMLVGPKGQKVLLMSDAGGASAVANLNLVFDDSAPGTLSIGSPILSGIYQPSDYSGDGDVFLPSGTPAAPSPNNPLSVFNGTDPNGIWTLYVMDDSGNSTGDSRVGEMAGGWMLSVQTAPVLSAIETPIAMQEDTAKDIIIDLGDAQPGIPTSYTFSANSNPTLIDTSKVTFSPVDGRSDQRHMVITPSLNQFGGADLSLFVTVGGSASATRTFHVEVAPVNDAATISGLPDPAVINTPAGLVFGPLSFTVSDIEGSNVVVTASSSNPALPSENILIGGSGSTRTMTIIPPAGTEAVTSVITLTVDDGGVRGTTSYPLTYNTTRGNIFASRTPIVIRDNGPADPYASTINIGTGLVQGLVGKVRVTLAGYSHPFPDDVHVLLVHGNKAVSLMGNAGGGGPTNSLGNADHAAVTLSFSSSASGVIPDADLIATGTWRPGDYAYSAAENAPTEAGGTAVAAGPYSTALSDFNLMDPSGDWKLYVWDDTRTDAGLIAGGWVLVIDAAPQITNLATVNADGVAVGTEDVPLAVDITLADSDTAASVLLLTAVTSDTSLINNSLIGFDRSTTNQLVRRLWITNLLNVSGNLTNEITLSANDGSSPVTTRLLKVKFTPVDDATTVATATNLVIINEDVPTSITVTFSDVDSVLDVTNIVITSSNYDVIPATNSANLSYTFPSGVTAGTTASLVVSLSPVANQNGDTTLSFGIKDDPSNSGRVWATSVVLRVLPKNDAPVISTIANYGSIRAGTNSAPVIFQVGEVSSPAFAETDAKLLNVTAAAFRDNGSGGASATVSTSVPANGITISQSGTNRVLTFTTVGVSAEDVVIVVTVTDGGGTVTGDTAALSTSTSFKVGVLAPLRQPGQTFANTAPLGILDLGSTNSNIEISGLAGKVYSLALGIAGFSHAAPDDVDVLLVAPDQGDSKPRKAVVILSDAGGRIPATNLFLTFRDDGRDGVARDDGPLTSGEYVPTNFSGDSDPFPTGFNILPTLGDLRGLNPNGNWTIYVVDDTLHDAGNIAQGWTLSLVTTPTIAIYNGAGHGTNKLVYAENVVGAASSGSTDVSVNDADVPSASYADYDLVFTSSDVGTIPVSGVSSPAGFGNKAITITPALNKYDVTTNLIVTATIRRKIDGASQSVVVTNLITPVNTAPQISRTIDRSTTEEVSNRDLRITITDEQEPGDDPAGRVLEYIQAVSSNSSVVASTNIQMVGYDGTISNRVFIYKGVDTAVTIIPSVNASPGGSSTSTVITITATDVHTNVATRLTSVPSAGFGQFTFTVFPKNDAPSIAIATADASQAVEAGSSKTVNLTVADPDDTAGIKVTGHSLDQNIIKDSSIVVSPETGGIGSRTVTFRVEPNIPASSTRIELSVVDKNGAAGSSAGSIVVITVNTTVSREVLFAGRNVAINPSGVSTPYPATINVDGLSGNISRVRVELLGLAHTYPDDVDMFLMSPLGTKVWLMSDAGGANSITNVNLIFAMDGAVGQIPDSDPILTSKIYRPANYPDVGSDSFASELVGGVSTSVTGPAAAATDLVAFNGQQAKGVWKLYINDDTSGDGGSFTAWNLYISTGPRMEGLTNQLLTVDEDNSFRTTFQLFDESLVPGDVTFGFASTNEAVVAPSGLTVSYGSGNDFTVSGFPVTNAFGSTEITVRATNANQVITGKFRVTVTPVDDAPSITLLPGKQTVRAGEALQVAFNYSDPETTKKDLVVSVTSDNQSLIPPSNVFQVGANLVIAAVGNLSGVANITIRVADPQGLFAESAFQVEVLPALQAQFANTNVISIPISGKAGTYPSTISVAGVKGLISKVTVTLAQMFHSYPADLDILLSSPAGASQKKVVLMSDAGGGRALAPSRLTFTEDSTNSVPYNPADPVAPGSYKPTNYEGNGDLWADVGAPFVYPSPDGTGLNAFRGLDPNGVWSLYIVDDSSPDSGSINGGWILNIYTTEPVVSAPATFTRPELVSDSDAGSWVPFLVTASKVDGTDNTTNLTVVASHQNPELLGVGNLQVRTRTGDPLNNREVLIKPRKYGNSEVSGPAIVSLDVSASGETTVSATMSVVITPVNQAPTIAGLTDQSVPSNRTLSVPFTVSDIEDPLGTNLTVTATLDRTAFGSLTISGRSGNNRILVFAPSGEKGTTGADVVVSDGGLSSTNHIVISVGEPYALSFSPIAPVLILENGQKVVPFTVLGADPDQVANITVTATVENSKVIQSAIVEGSGISWVITLKAVSGANGSSAVTLTATDSFGTGATSFNASIVAVDDPPTIAAIADVTTYKNVNAIVRTAVVDPDTAADGLEFTWASSNPVLVRNVLFSYTGSTLVANVIPNRDAVGEASLTIFVNDGTTKVGRPFLLKVLNPPNLAPVLGPVADQETYKNVPAFVRLTVTDSDTELSDLVVTAVPANSTLIQSAVAAFGSDGSILLNVRPRRDQVGQSSIQVSVFDGANTVTRSFILTVKETPNEAPSLDAIADQTTDINKAITITLGVSDPDTAIADLVFAGTSSNPSVISGVTFSNDGAVVKATVTPATDVAGLATVTITVNDGKTTVPRTFAVIVKAAPAPTVAKPTVTKNADGSATLTVTWENGGELEWAPTPSGPWTKTGNTSGSYSEAVSSGAKFFRVSRKI